MTSTTVDSKRYAIIRTGGKQYKVSEGDILDVERLAAETGDTIELTEVLLVGGDGAEAKIGRPLVEGAIVQAEVIDQRRADKVLFFHYKNKTRQAKKKGHHQLITRLQISEIRS